MHSNYQIPEDIQIMLVGYLTGTIADSDLLKLNEWIKSSSDNRELFRQFKASWLLASNPDNIKETDTSLLWTRIENEIAVTKKPSRSISIGEGLKLFKYAASLILMLGLGSALTWWFMQPAEQFAKTTEYTVPKGSKSTIKLPDGSVVWLNAGSKLQYSNDFDKKERNVYLTGEAYFSVVTNKKKPFKVHTSDILVRALGTKFNVKAYPEERTITTTLEEGIIDVQVMKGDKSGSNQIKIKPHEKMVFYKSEELESTVPREIAAVKEIKLIDKNIRVESNIKTELYTSWKNDKWIIEGITLKCLAPMLERRYNIKIHFNNDGLDQYKFSGILQNETVEQIFDVLRYTAPIRYEIIKDSIYLSIDQKAKQNFERIITTRNE